MFCLLLWKQCTLFNLANLHQICKMIINSESWGQYNYIGFSWFYVIRFHISCLLVVICNNLWFAFHCRLYIDQNKLFNVSLCNSDMCNWSKLIRVLQVVDYKQIRKICSDTCTTHLLLEQCQQLTLMPRELFVIPSSSVQSSIFVWGFFQLFVLLIFEIFGHRLHVIYSKHQCESTYTCIYLV